MGLTNKYECVTTVQGIKDYIGNAKEVAFDYETAPDKDFVGLDCNKGKSW